MTNQWVSFSDKGGFEMCYY